MMNRKCTWISLGLCALALSGMSITMTGCGEDQPVVQAPPPPPPPPPPAPPAVTPIEQLMAELNIDQRVTLPEDRAPDNNADRKAVLEFYDAMARGNDKALRGLLAETDKRELDALVESGAWKETTGKIKHIDVETGTNAMSQKCALAIIEVASIEDPDFQPQLWYYTTDQENPTFEAAPTPPGILDRLSGDKIAAWHQVLADELAEANKPDTEYEVVQNNLDDGHHDTAPSSGGNTPGTAPMPGGGRPVPPPAKPPGLPSPGGGR